jgi:hypothetical protein
MIAESTIFEELVLIQKLCQYFIKLLKKNKIIRIKKKKNIISHTKNNINICGNA